MAGSRAQTLLRPSRDWTPLTQVGALTLSAGVITDVTRLAGVEGDGVTPPDGSVYVGPAATNLGDAVGDMSFESLAVGSDMATDGWTNSTGGTAVVSTDVAKFGTKSGKLTTGGASAFQRLELPLGSQAIGTYTWSVWLYAPSPLSKVQLMLTNSTDGGTLTGDQSITNVWKKVSVTKTTTAVEALTARIYVSYGINTVGAVLYLSGPQPETGVIATPFTPTSRGAGRIQVEKSGVFNPTQGWVAACIEPAWAATAAPTTYPRVIDANIDTNNGVHLFYNTFGGANKWGMKTENGGVNEEIDSSVRTFSAGDLEVPCGYWKADELGVAVNGSAFSTVARTAGVPDLSSTSTFDIGREHFQDTSHFHGKFRWVIGGTGILPANAPSLFYSWRNGYPLHYSLGTASGVSYLWVATGDGTMYRYV